MQNHFTNGECVLCIRKLCFIGRMPEENAINLNGMVVDRITLNRKHVFLEREQSQSYSGSFKRGIEDLINRRTSRTPALVLPVNSRSGLETFIIAESGPKLQISDCYLSGTIFVSQQNCQYCTEQLQSDDRL